MRRIIVVTAIALGLVSVCAALIGLLASLASSSSAGSVSVVGSADCKFSYSFNPNDTYAVVSWSLAVHNGDTQAHDAVVRAKVLFHSTLPGMGRYTNSEYDFYPAALTLAPGETRSVTLTSEGRIDSQTVEASGPLADAITLSGVSAYDQYDVSCEEPWVVIQD